MAGVMGAPGAGAGGSVSAGDSASAALTAAWRIGSVIKPVCTRKFTPALSTASTREVSSCEVMGLERNALAPASSAICLSIGWLRAVRMMSGICAVAGSSRILRTTS